MVKLLAAFRLFADHYQFFVHDAAEEWCPVSFFDEPDHARTTDRGGYSQGFITNGTSINMMTHAHYNDHWIEVFLSDTVPDFGDAESVLALPLQLNSGQVAVSDLLSHPGPGHVLPVPPGRYTVYTLGYSLWGEHDDEEEMPTDAEVAAHSDWEHYRIVLVPGDTGQDGFLRGAPA